jgi:predicted RNA binding protein YcfA (HicA-like mRNA interferase family)
MPRMAPVHWRVLERVFLKAGWRFARQEGGHRSYVKPGIIRPMVIPAYDQVPVAVIHTNLKTAGIGREEYFRLIEE